MAAREDFLYAGARVQARYGPRTSPAAWARLAGLSSASEWLAGLAATELRPYLAGLEPESGVHALELELRRRFHREVEAVARWVPVPWCATMRWTSLLPDLALLAAIARGDALPDWATDDPVAIAMTRDPSAARDPLSDPGGLLARISAGALPLAAWTELWRARWPRDGARGKKSLRKLADDMVETLPGNTTSAAAGPAKLARRLEGCFRRHTRDAAGVAAYLVLRWLDTRRLRGGLAQRLLSDTAGNGNAGA
ncbi:MAG TPA: hypothetical protein VFA95_11435 [Gammaproteobacteria bacterium]|nr:hypothetical protein [Gammaproteobacteria bacterium]